MHTTDVPRERLSDTERIQAAQDNLFDMFRAFALLEGAELEEGRTLSRHHAFPSNPMFKGVWACRFPGDGYSEAIDESLAWFAARDAPFVFWWLGPGTDPNGLRAALESRGLAAWDVDSPCMTADLQALGWGALERVPSGFSIQEVRDDDQLETWARTFVAAFEVPEWAAQAWVDASRAFGIEKSPWRLYLGLLDGDPVATNMLVPGAGVAGVLGVGTVAAARRQGIGAATTLRVCADALDLGYRYAALFSTEIGLPVYRRIGFDGHEAWITRYLWRQE